MRHLLCTRCGKRLIDDFWVMVDAGPVPVFSSVTLTCECGEVVSVATAPRVKWLPNGEQRARFELRQ